MKRLLLVLGLCFLVLWIVGLFYPGRTKSIHIALIVEILFFLQALMTTKETVFKKTGSAEI